MSDVEDRHREAASAAIVEAWGACTRKQYMATGVLLPNCDCDSGQMDGCKALVAAVAKAIAAAEPEPADKFGPKRITCPKTGAPCANAMVCIGYKGCWAEG